MRKFCIALVAFFVCNANVNAQNEPNYLTIITTGFTSSKNFSGGTEKDLHLKVQGVYGSERKIGLAYHAVRIQPLGHKTGGPMEQYTVISLGIGKVKHLAGSSVVAFGGGPTVGMVPNHGSIPKTSTIFYGGTIHANLVNSVHIGTDVTFLTRPQRNQNDWAKNMLVAELEATYFFNDLLGIKVMYLMETSSDIEKQVPNLQFNQNRYTDRRSNLTGGLCLRFGPAIILAGANIRTEGQKYGCMDQYGVYQTGKYSNSMPIGMHVALNFIFEKED